MKFVAGLISTFFGAGYFPLVPGTFASLIIALGYRFAGAGLPLLPFLGLAVVVLIIGVAAADVHARTLKQKDPRPIVIDEAVGQWIALYPATAEWGWIFLGFFLFRVFDVLKPWPIRELERLPGGWGIMADDVLAGLFGAAGVQTLRWIFP